MRIHAIALGALLAAGCSAPDNDAGTSPSVAEHPAREPPTQPGSPPASLDDEDTNIVPRRFQGEYAADTPACTTPAHESRLTIGKWRIKFHESSGAIIAVEDDGDGDITITTELTGEGETRQATHHFNLSDDGQTLTDTDSGMTRRRC